MVLQILQSAILFENGVSLVDIVVCVLFRHLLVLNFYTDAFLVLGQWRVADVDDLKLRWNFGAVILGIEAFMRFLIA